ncbi:hypothetical protein [Sutcliffiella cohnii]|uniref:hypothetical protein n=1 Tax=Sutcliffiella cohnii TaxID=33932 RepID=UPI002E22CAF0|nr:hypothetical protein [Sutcliffiella cohnii]
MSYEVIKSFKDKYTKRLYVVGSGYESEDNERIEHLQELGYLNAEEKEIKYIHVGAGYYELPNGEKVRGKKKAEERLKELVSNE